MKWKPVNGYVGQYEVSDSGQIKSLARTVKRSGRAGNQFWRERILKPATTRRGYLSVSLRGSSYLVHRLVAAAFLERQDEYKEVNHRNGIKSDNRADNLEWCDRSMNMRHARDIIRTHQGNLKTPRYSPMDILEIRASKKNHQETAALYGGSISAISRIKLGQTWQLLSQ